MKSDITDYSDDRITDKRKRKKNSGGTICTYCETAQCTYTVRDHTHKQYCESRYEYILFLELRYIIGTHYNLQYYLL